MKGWQRPRDNAANRRNLVTLHDAATFIDRAFDVLFDTETNLAGEEILEFAAARCEQVRLPQLFICASRLLTSSNAA